LRAVDVNGQWHDLSDWVGRQPVVINFWGTWCPPCRREIPGLIRLYDEYRGRGIEIVSLAIERRAGPAQVKQFTQQAGMKWVQLMANEDVARNFRLTGSVPTTIFFDANGREVARHIGARTYDVFKMEFEKIAVGS
jgi:thiol-disulfide isomerase/thioredoxin